MTRRGVWTWAAICAVLGAGLCAVGEFPTGFALILFADLLATCNGPVR